ncbi:MAG: type II toxin-antitoxin system RelB/DinJ family antitoxin [Defluviitaleaceae bacterium]|nr:type II toxin-antitoxin system RelB/DinJ family antitoxin [Defluviitaleaceae bacterium]
MAQVNIRIEDNLKERADEIFDELGLNMSTAFTMFIKAAVRQRGIPFDVVLDPFYSEKNMQVLEASIKDADAGRLSVHELIED